MTLPPRLLHRHQNLDIEIGPGQGRSYPLSLRAPAGETDQTLEFPFDFLALESRLKDLQIALLRTSGPRRRRKPSPRENPGLQLGRAFFQALFSDSALSLFDRSLEHAEAEDAVLRLRLRIQPAELAALPWEYLYDARYDRYLSLYRNTSIVRSPALPQAVRPYPIQPPLRILGMIADPLDLPRLDVENEKRRIDTALKGAISGGLVTLEWLPGGSWRDLQRGLRRGDWNIFHFLGHGGFDIQSEEGYLALEGEDGASENLAASKLTRLLSGRPALRLAVLNSCAGGQSSQTDLFSSTAASLVRGGLPAALAMQFDISDGAAVELSHTFYETLAGGAPLEEALTETRIALSMEDTLEWGVPVLYMRLQDGALFEIAPARPPAQPEAPKKPKKRRARKSPAKASPAQSAAPPQAGPAPAEPAPAKAAIHKPPPAGLLRLPLAPGVDLPLAAIPPQPEASPAPGMGGYAYWMGKYPVTNAEYACFLASGEFYDPDLWRGFPQVVAGRLLYDPGPEEGWAWLAAHRDPQGLLLPREWNHPVFGVVRPDHPVVGLTWYEACAFCCWVERRWAAQRSLGAVARLEPLPALAVRLPTAAEWTWAAGGNDPDERYPWDGPGQSTRDPAEIIRRANLRPSNLLHTTRVGAYSPQGDSPPGCADMCGNVWEWVANSVLEDRAVDWLERPVNLRGVRGGSWESPVELARVAAMLAEAPGYSGRHIGFRVAVLAEPA